MCEECLQYGTPVTGAACTEQESSAGFSGPTGDTQTPRADVGDMDLKRCSGCAEPFAVRRARRVDHGQKCSGRECDLLFVSTQTNRSWMYACAMCQRHLCTECYAKELGRVATTRAARPTVAPPRKAHAPPEPQTNACHEHLLHLISKIDALPQSQIIQWISRGLDRRKAAIRKQALDRAMQAAKSNTAASTQKLWSKMTLLIAHLILRVALGHKEHEDGLRSVRDEIRKRLALEEKGYLEQLLKGAIDDQEKEKQQEKKHENPGYTDRENDSFRRAAEAADSSQTAQRFQTSPANGSDSRGE